MSKNYCLYCGEGEYDRQLMVCGACARTSQNRTSIKTALQKLTVKKTLLLIKDTIIYILGLLAFLSLALAGLCSGADNPYF
jgi:hypothetical protein